MPYFNYARNARLIKNQQVFFNRLCYLNTKNSKKKTQGAHAKLGASM
ncbi:hypothetical protein THERMOS_797 [Bathymodiolus thermophilus thioautotrophic gill symbiont]|uniref:Uncharacterized protein n=1 Tax=Bathymodiolus thermophilus thioautotrophic gill symbiont TaxID=2360 RepID=A0A8H8XC77_9GAMM|nr:hypothetical protein THERMOS_797 [Bathymodiolus thermophilus thioautotrophic gill symbiont]